MTTAATTKKLACHLERGDVIRYERRAYRVGGVGLAVAIPRNGGASRAVYKVTLWSDRGTSRQLTFEQNDLVALVTK